jgi:hypothetical protein
VARIQPEEVVDHLSSEFKPALEAAVNEVCPSAQFDRNELFRAFRRAVRRKCSTWENVPDRYVDCD